MLSMNTSRPRRCYSPWRSMAAACVHTLIVCTQPQPLGQQDIMYICFLDDRVGAPDDASNGARQKHAPQESVARHVQHVRSQHNHALSNMSSTALTRAGEAAADVAVGGNSTACSSVSSERGSSVTASVSAAGSPAADDERSAAHAVHCFQEIVWVAQSVLHKSYEHIRQPVLTRRMDG